MSYSDADWANDLDDRDSTTGNVFIMSCGAVSWLKPPLHYLQLKQKIIIIALGSATQEATWLRQLLADHRIDTQTPIEILENNQGAMAIAKNSVEHKRTNKLILNITSLEKLWNPEQLN